MEQTESAGYAVRKYTDALRAQGHEWPYIVGALEYLLEGALEGIMTKDMILNILTSFGRKA